MGKPGILVAPSEPLAFKTLGRVSAIPEKFGADAYVPALRLGIQRKQVNDLVASLTDGRLAKEMLQMKRLLYRVLIVEGRFAWTADGEWVNGFTRFTRDQYWGCLLSVQQGGVMVLHSSDTQDTIRCVREVVAWASKKSHAGLETRGKGLVSKWGTRDDEDWAAWVLQGFEGIGPKQARAIVKQFGRVPLVWDVSEQELQKVPGIGKVRAAGLMRALRNGRQ